LNESESTRSAPPFSAATGGVLAALAALASVLRLAPGARPVDDAYITFRYARNLVEGIGLVYNQGEAVLGTSTPGFTLLLAAGSAIFGGAPPTVALVASAVADAVTAVLVVVLGLSLGLPRALAVLASLGWVLYPLSIRYAIGGMETSVVAALGAATFLLWIRGRETLAMIPAGAAVLTRPDAAVHAVVLLAATAVRTRRIPWRPAVVLAAALLPWSVFALVRYGTPVPQSLEAKSHAVYAAAVGENALQILYALGGLVLAAPASLAARGLSVWRPVGDRALPIAVAAIVLAVFLVGAREAMRRDRRMVVLFVSPVLFWVAYALAGLRGGLLAEWYLVPLAPLLFVGLAAGVWSLARRLPTVARQPVAASVLAALVALQLTGFDWAAIGRGAAPVPRVVWTEREDLYRRAAAYLVPRLAPADVVAAPEIGALGYFCRCRILDTVGLVSPESVRYYPLPAEMHLVSSAVPPDLIRDARPAWLVTLDVFIGRSLLPLDWFAREYEPVVAAPTRAFGSRALVVYRRRDTASAQPALLTPSPGHYRQLERAEP
jgi:hypothetical protein